VSTNSLHSSLKASGDIFCLAFENACFDISGKFKYECSSINLLISAERDFRSAEQIK